MSLKNNKNTKKTKKTKKQKIQKAHHNINSNIVKAICVLHKNNYGITGIISFKQNLNASRVKISYNIKGLKDGKHGFHIHEYGDLTDGCTSSCAHFNPFNTTHGGRKSRERHVGDLGNITSKNNIAKGSFYDTMISLDVKNICNIIGRSIVIHKDPDDLGNGGNDESLITGNAGKRLACGIIGLQKLC